MKAREAVLPALLKSDHEHPIPFSANNDRHADGSAWQVLVKIIACSVCRTDFHIIDNELANPKLPLIPGHEIIGTVVQVGGEAVGVKVGDAVGIPWVGYTFGAAAHILIQVAIRQGKKIYAFTRDGDLTAQTFAIRLGAVWAGGSSESPSEKLDAAILFAPVGQLVPKALQDIDKAGTVVCGGIHMSDIPTFKYEWLWQERMIRSVANLTRRDGHEFLALAALRNGEIVGAVALVV